MLCRLVASVGVASVRPRPLPLAVRSISGEPSWEHVDPAQRSGQGRQPVAKRTLFGAMGRNDAVTAKRALASVDLKSLSVVEHSKLIKLFAHANDLRSMEELYEAMPEPDIVVFASVIKANLRHGQLHRAADLLERMMACGIQPDNSRLAAGILQHLSYQPDLDGQDRVLALVPSLVHSSDLPRFNDEMRFMEGFEAKERYLSLMRRVGLRPSIVACNIMIDAAAKKVDLPRAGRYFAQIKDLGLEPDTRSYTSLIEALGRAGKYNGCFETAKTMRANGVPLSEVTYVQLMLVAGMDSRLELVQALLRECLEKFPTPSPRVYLQAMIGFVKCRDIHAARDCLVDMRRRGIELEVAHAHELAKAVFHYTSSGRRAAEALLKLLTEAKGAGRQQLNDEERIMLRQLLGERVEGVAKEAVTAEGEASRTRARTSRQETATARSEDVIKGTE
eukprot:TRINITY_DN9843_c0_g1_i1.p1 TRINITY_DN9843_c0_g1~~TRINITY_DN9843_c0_g1_i1.p1  ORF type:complete len:448 (+),score=152.97 TRINITY_DN9843_c0_g1_i1:120-1463(+)